VRQVMFNVMNLRLQFDLILAFEGLLHGRGASDIFDLLPHRFGVRPVGEHKPDPPPVVNSRFAVNGDVLHVV
jgi:hypothetical protein